MRSLPLSVIVSLLVAASCSTQPQSQQSQKAMVEPLPDQELKDAIEVISKSDTADEIEETDLDATEPAEEVAPEFEDGADHTNDLAVLKTEIPMELNQQVKKW